MVKKDETQDEIWMSNFYALLEFGDRNGHCNVPHTSGSKLGYWLSDQRTNWRKGILRQDRVDALQELVNAGKLEWNPGSVSYLYL